MTDMTPEMKAAIEAAVADATEKLKAKNNELIKQVRDLNAGKKTAEEEAEDAKAEAERKAGDITALEKRLNDGFERKLAAMTTERDNALGELKTMKIDNVVSKSLIDNNVPKHFHGPLTAMFKNGATIEGAEAVFDGKPLADAVKGYFTSDEGKHYVAAPQNSGAGAIGSTATTGDRWSKLSANLGEWSSNDQIEFGQLANSNPALYNSIVAQKGLPDNMKV